jgi:hypothetical protein
MNRKAEVIAFYLPQFHQIPENNKWWGDGFTEWTNVIKSKPLYKNHYQPRVPGKLGYYDLLETTEIKSKQALLAKENGIAAFCYWHYWFGNGKMLLEKPLQDFVKSGKPDFPICLAWANESWSGIWHGAPHQLLMKQEYPGKEDYIKHFYHLIDAFADPRYFKAGHKNLFAIYKPYKIPDLTLFIDTWQNLALKNNLPPFYFLGISRYPSEELIKLGLDGFILSREYFTRRLKQRYFYHLLLNKVLNRPSRTIDYKIISQHFILSQKFDNPAYPVIINDWDNTPRVGKKGIIYKNSSPGLYKIQVQKAIQLLHDNNYKHKFIFARAWNEWAEGNYLEPDEKWGDGYLKVIKEEIFD